MDTLRHGTSVDAESHRIAALVEERIPEIREFKGSFKPGGNGDQICSGLMFNATADLFSFKVLYAAELKAKTAEVALEELGVPGATVEHNRLTGIWELRFELPQGWQPT
jgi:hypothetical protein